MNLSVYKGVHRLGCYKLTCVPSSCIWVVFTVLIVAKVWHVHRTYLVLEKLSSLLGK